jgi:hypothetical protein
VERALSRGEFAPLEHRVVIAMGVFGIALGALTILAVLLEV